MRNANRGNSRRRGSGKNNGGSKVLALFLTFTLLFISWPIMPVMADESTAVTANSQDASGSGAGGSGQAADGQGAAGNGADGNSGSDQAQTPPPKRE